jgi:hypothetical protein
MSQEAVTKRERRLAAREDRKRRASVAQRNARLRQWVLMGIATVILVAFVVTAIWTSFFGLMSTPIGSTRPIEGADHVPDTQPVTYKSRPPSSGPHSSSVAPRYGLYDTAPPTGQWLHNLEHGAVAFLYNCPSGCPEVVQQFQELYPTLQLGRNARRGSARALIFPYQDMDKQIAAVAWGWVLELDSFDKDQLTKFFDARIDRGPECQGLVCPEM